MTRRLAPSPHRASHDSLPANDTKKPGAKKGVGRIPRHGVSTKDDVDVWMPNCENFGYSRREAEQLVRIAQRLWKRYTALGLTVDSANSTAVALDRFEVLVQAAWHFGLRQLSRDRGGGRT